MRTTLDAPSPATQPGALPAPVPTVSTASQGHDLGSSGHNRTTASMKELCNACGCDWQQAHFIAGRLLCERCWAGREPAAAMPPTPAERRQLDLWMAPQSRCAP
jgi:hypothetical protein